MWAPISKFMSFFRRRKKRIRLSNPIGLRIQKEGDKLIRSKTLRPKPPVNLGHKTLRIKKTEKGKKEIKNAGFFQKRNNVNAEIGYSGKSSRFFEQFGV